MKKREIKGHEDFLKNREPGQSWECIITKDDGTKETHIGVECEIVSKYGKVKNVMICDNDDNPLFDRPAYSEAPNVNIIAWGNDPVTGKVKIGIITEERPHADNPENPEDKESLKFFQVPMGFMDKVMGKLESGLETSTRETREESGATAVIGWTRPNYPWQNPSPTFVATWNDLYFIQVDLAKIGEFQNQYGEAIYKAEYIEVKEVLRRIREGKNADGVIFRAATSLSLLMIFLANYPDLWEY